MNYMSNLIKLFLAIFLIQSLEGSCQIILPRLISDGMILQRNTEIKIWGWASANETLELLFKDKKYQTIADQKGDWAIILPPQEAGGPFNLVLNASNNITIRNVLFGDVWVCSGQSNMELTMERVKEKYKDVITVSENENIRQFVVPDKYDFKLEHRDFDAGNWESVDSGSVLNFSAVSYFFAKELYEVYRIPVGLINASLGGSPVEAWMSEDALLKFPSAYNTLQKFKNDSLIASIQENDKKRTENWYNELNRKDRGLANVPHWYETTCDDDDWKSMEIPGFWANHSTGDINGVVWFRKQINISKSMASKTAKLWLGRIVDQDYTYVNGKLAGTTGYQYPPRRYSVNSTILKEGKNTIAIRVINSSGKGGFIPDKPYYLAVGYDTIDLKGNWNHKLGATMQPLESQTSIRWKPAGLYNRMIAPISDYSIKGVIWYQGESNASNPLQYAETFPAMIRDWRQKWDQGDFPFLFVQLANYMEEKDLPAESNWAELRQAQLNTLEVPNTGMAVAIDLGEWNDIHPLNKQDVGKRLAMQARALAYHDNEIFASSPVPASADFQRKKVFITFNHVGNGLVVKNKGSLEYFSISIDGKNFVRANAEIKGNVITVWNEKIKSPTVVRYAWADNPGSANLYTKDGLPASPFQVKKE